MASSSSTTPKFYDLDTETPESPDVEVREKRLSDGRSPFILAKLWVTPMIILSLSVATEVRFKLFGGEQPSRNLNLKMTTTDQGARSRFKKLDGFLESIVMLIGMEKTWKSVATDSEYGTTLHVNVKTDDKKAKLRVEEHGKGKKSPQLTLSTDIKTSELSKKLDGRTWRAAFTAMIHEGYISKQGNKSVSVQLSELRLIEEIVKPKGDLNLDELNQRVAAQARAFRLHQQNASSSSSSALSFDEDE